MVSIHNPEGSIGLAPRRGTLTALLSVEEGRGIEPPCRSMAADFESACPHGRYLPTSRNDWTRTSIVSAPNRVTFQIGPRSDSPI